MCRAILAIGEREGVAPDAIYVWVDWVSIPQRVKSVQQLSISSLPLFASLLHCFVVVTPEAMHHESRQRCDRSTFHSRCWCRAEVMSHWARRGAANMYYADEEGLQPMAPKGVASVAEEEDFLSSIHVFEGELSCCALGHPGGRPCDRELLVLPILGLYGQIYEQVRCGHPPRPVSPDLA